MAEIRKRTTWVFFGVIVAQVILVSWQVQTKSGVRVLSAVTFGTFSRVQFATAGAVNAVRGTWTNYVALRHVRVENTDLRRQVEDLEVRLQGEHALAERSARLQALMDLKTQAALPTIAAEVIAGNPDPAMRTVTINRGSAEGVQADMAVIAPLGVVGRIIGPVARHAARVQLIVDRNAAAGALSERTRAGGMITGADADPPLRMDLVSNFADVKAGDHIVTSGVDGVYPKGYLIGQVERSDRGGGLYRTISVVPAVDFSSLEEVLVVLEPPRPAVRDEAPK